MILGLNEKEYFASGHRACPGCGQALAVRLVLKAAGDDTIIVNATGCLEVFSTPYPETSWKLPYIHVAFENAAAVASGVYRALKIQNKKANILALAGDGGTFDIGLQALSGALERKEKFTYVCFDNSAYMNTGVQRSGATEKYMETTTTPYGKKIHGNLLWKKPMPFIIAAHNASYVATASVDNPIDINNKIKKALNSEGVSYVQIFSPCPLGWKHESNKTIEIAKLAVESRFYPIFEIENGILKLKNIENPKDVKTFLAMQGRFKHVSDNDIDEIKRYINDQWNRLLELDKSKAKL